MPHIGSEMIIIFFSVYQNAWAFSVRSSFMDYYLSAAQVNIITQLSQYVTYEKIYANFLLQEFCKFKKKIQ